ncbi:1-phosphofructokinase [Clostridium sp. MB40-C1]|uniref:1-phosphofructokinase n=1 Tax=Clostridium sp. MB40-C1 TaxID=3070996 RepID=UPI0027E0AF8F|nr:1-phosphofructokinase [Clostridium sp. MB40-C1]WMJ82256.1 1-phosphofructokinase [Clostridium sp. MB40-C1]
MITTITFNPSIDKHYILDDLIKGEVTRAKEVQNTAGGKGLNVSRVIRLLGESVTATGFLGGNSGDFIVDKLSELKINNRFIKVKGETRSCLAIITKELAQTEILEPGPTIQEDEMAEWVKAYDEILEDSSIICASGSLPRGLSVSTYGEIIKKANIKGAKFLLDTSGEALKKGIESKPYFIKPNIDELKAITGESINSDNDVLKIIDKIHDKGIKLVMVSLGANGSIAGFNGKKYRIYVPKIKAVNPVGSGDSMVAGIAVALERGYNIEDVLAFASATGTANAMEQQTGYVNINNVNKVKEEIRIELI